MVGDASNELVLDCYRLARWYHQNPEVFLQMPLSAVRQHLVYTSEITAKFPTQDDDD